MATLILGLILLLIPLVLVNLFLNKKKGFIYVLFFWLLFHTFLALLIQSLTLFYYWLVTACVLIADAVVLIFYFTLRLRSGQKTKKGKKPLIKKIDWVLIAVAIICLLSFYQIHYNYTGAINFVSDDNNEYKYVENKVYPYPYFSDEWYSVDLIQSSIDNQFLPIENSLNNKFFLNLEILFHSFLAQIMLILGLNPLLQYTVISIFINSLIIVLIYLFLRLNNISKLASGVCSLLALYIVSGSNLPGLWYLVPLTFGIIFFLLTLCFAEFEKIKMVLFSAVIASLFYPPLIPFYLIVVLLFPLLKKKKEKILSYKIILNLFLLLALLTLVFLMLAPSVFNKVSNYLISRTFFQSFVLPYATVANFYDIMPLPAILLAIFGLYFIYKNKKLTVLAGFILGVVYWTFYSLSSHRLFTEYERIVIITSIIVVIISGFGLSQIENFVKTKFKKPGLTFLITAEILALLMFLFLALSYTQQEQWKKIILIHKENGSIKYPRSPANSYLTDDDLKIFKGIKEKNFLSLPWKGATIGISTQNYPVLAKQGTMSVGSQNVLDKFMGANCKKKTNLAKKLNLDYIYLYKIDCPGFKKIARSQEGFTLYKTINEPQN